MNQEAQLKFGLLLPMVSGGTTPGALLAELEAEARLAEESGLSLILVPEHHHGPENSLSDALTVATWLLAKTTQIHIGTGVLVAPVHDPTTLCERASIMQHASNGRVILGLGAGYQVEDFEVFDEDVTQRKRTFEASFRAVRRVSSGQAILNGRSVIPATNTFPPLWIGAWSSAGVELAAQFGDSWLIDPIRGTSELRRMTVTYQAACERADTVSSSVLLRHTWVARDDATARAEFAPVIEPIYRYYQRHGGLGDGRDPETGQLTLGDALDDRVVCGSPDTVVKRLAELIQVTNASAVVLSLRQPGGPSHTAVCNAICLLAKEVFPRLTAIHHSSSGG